MHDRRADLRLDVVTDDRHPGLLEALAPVGLAGDEDRNAIDERTSGCKRLLDVPLRRLLGPDRGVGDDHVGLSVAQDVRDLRRLARRLGDLLLQVLSEPVMSHPALDRDAGSWNLGELECVVLAGPNRLRQVLADLRGVDVERG